MEKQRVHVTACTHSKTLRGLLQLNNFKNASHIFCTALMLLFTPMHSPDNIAGLQPLINYRNSFKKEKRTTRLYRTMPDSTCSFHVSIF